MAELEYNKDTEELFIRFFLTKPEIFIRCLAIVNSQNYVDAQHRKAIDFLKEHADKYNTLPTTDQLKVVSGKEFSMLDSIQDGHEDWFLDQYEHFARHKELEREIIASADLLEKGRYGEVEARIKKAVQIGLVKDLGTDYFTDPKTRLEAMLNKEAFVPTGWKALDDKLYGGYTRGSLNLFLGQSGAGKSIFLQNSALNFVEQGLHGIYISYELSERLCSMRLDSMVSGYSTKDVFKNIDNVSMKVSSYGKKHKGSLIVKQMLSSSTTNDLRSFIKEYQVQTGRKVDFLAVDYLDLMDAHGKKISVDNVFQKDKLVSEELRNLAIELDMIIVSASQFNRSSYQADTSVFDNGMVAGGKSKIDTADNVFGIFITNAMREAGRYQLQLMKTRSSSGVGSTIDLKFDTTSLRVGDLAESDESAYTSTTNSVIEKLKAQNKIKPNEKNEESNPLESGLKLRDMLKRSS